MAVELRQNLKLTQQLVMTPQLQQAIKLLQVSRLDLVDIVRQEVNENPILEEAQDSGEGIEAPDIIKGDDLHKLEKDTKTKSEEKILEDVKWENYSYKIPQGSYSKGSINDDKSFLENILAKKTSLYDHLMWQLSLSRFLPEEYEAGRVIIGNLDNNGYLKISLSNLTSSLKCNEDFLENVLKKIQDFDPPGVAARDIKECLILQLEYLEKEDNLHSFHLEKKIIENHLENLGNKNYQAIAKSLGVDLDRIIDAAKFISSLEPKPGRPFNDIETQYITPDLYVYRQEDDFIVLLNEDGQPKLKINPLYSESLIEKNSFSSETKSYIQEKMRSAIWLIKSIYNRQNTIRNVMKSILKFQREFFEKGPGYIKPMVLRDVAEDIGMHESTVSRVTSNKYVYTEYGIFELKYFFNSSINSLGGDVVSSEKVKDMIKQIIQNEIPQTPHSDNKIVKILAQHNINIARRTVTKYREMMGILSSAKRKKIFK
ncbi:MAG: RNA polymerase factor sigma-54 [Thermodesulfobacteriota bacterium]|nr:RNA polymerase factor sigma-54 [Thermodesulfobacteriota bacterium]